MFQKGDKVYHRALKQYGTFLELDWASDKDAVVSFIEEDGYEDIKCVTLNLLDRFSPKKPELE